jgi:hypothetical protein
MPDPQLDPRRAREALYAQLSCGSLSHVPEQRLLLGRSIDLGNVA